MYMDVATVNFFTTIKFRLLCKAEHFIQLTSERIEQSTVAPSGQPSGQLTSQPTGYWICSSEIQVSIC